MKESFEQLYQEMLQDIDRCQALQLPEKEKAEKCFWIARGYSKRLKALMEGMDFEDEEEEIVFFRDVKPTFVCYIEYFLLVSDAILMAPAKREEAILFWEDEKGRLQRFRQDQATFISYYENEQHDLDTTYFLRKNNHLNFMPNLHIYDSDIDWCTSHDRLVRNYKAYKMYNAYCKKKINES